MAVAQEGSTSAGREWNALLVGKKDVAAATRLCTSWETDGTPEQKLEAEKCLTAVVLQGAPLYTVKDARAGAPKYPAPLADEALAHINRGLALAPADMKLNVGRLFVLAEAHRYEAVGPAFEDTLKNMPEGDWTADWQQVIADMVADGVPRGALAVAEVLYAHFPDSHEAAGNVGSLHDMLKEWDQGLPFLRKAVELAPADAIDTWNLGSALDRMGEDDEAQKWMSASLKLTSDPESLKQRRCLYGQFLVVKRRQTAQGCTLIRSACGLKTQPPVCAVAAGRKPGK